jgi:hypothetical protein
MPRRPKYELKKAYRNRTAAIGRSRHKPRVRFGATEDLTTVGKDWHLSATQRADLVKRWERGEFDDDFLNGPHKTRVRPRKLYVIRHRDKAVVHAEYKDPDNDIWTQRVGHIVMD